MDNKISEKCKQKAQQIAKACHNLSPETKKQIKIGAIAFSVGLLFGLLIKRRRV